ncbi:unnamed protein product, partial [Adineta steineri]
PFKQHSYLQTRFQHNVLQVYSSIYDCFYQLTSNHHQQYILFLSLTSFELQSFELERLSNVSLCIFYEDDHQSHVHISKTKYHIRFIFPQACLLEYVRHAVILNYIKQAHQYRVEGLENEADENYLEASDQCRMLASDLEEQSGIINGREATDVIVNDREDVSESYLQSFTDLNEQ